MPNAYLPPVITIPSALEITNISNAQAMVVTTSADSDQVNSYIIGQLVILTVPVPYGMWQANGLSGTIISVSGNQLTLNINSLQFDPFVTPPSAIAQNASLAPAGSRNLQYSNDTDVVPFQSLNNIGN